MTALTKKLVAVVTIASALSGCTSFLRAVPDAAFSYEEPTGLTGATTISCNRGLQPSQAAEMARLIDAFPAAVSGNNNEGVLKSFDPDSNGMNVSRIDLALQVCIRLLDATE